MDTNKKLELARAKKTMGENPIEKAISETVAQTVGTDLTPKLEKFVGDLDRLLGGGIHIENLDDINSVCDAVKKFGVEADGLIDRLAKLLASFPELDIPKQIELSYDKSIADSIRELQLELPQELSEKIAGLDLRLEKLASILSVKQAPSKRVDDYQPVRIVVGPESDLRYLLDMPSSFGGGSSIGITDAQIDRLQGFPLPDYDEIELDYTEDNLTGVIYKKAGSTVGTLTLSYEAGKLIGVVLS